MTSSLGVAIALLLAAWIALELRVSSAFLEIAAGVCLSALFVDLKDLHWLHFLAEVGVVALMFTAGFEVDLARLRRMWRGCLALGCAAFFVPMGGVFLFAWLWADLSATGAVLVGIGLSTTSLALVYQGLKEADMLRTGEGQALLAGAMVVDVLSMVSLALLMGDVGWGSGTLLLVILGSLFGLPRLGKWFFSRYSGSVAEPELRFLLLLIVAIGLTTENVGGIHPAVVAFALGVAMGRVVVEHSAVEQKLKGVVFGLFAPIFFLRAGTQLDMSALSFDVLASAGSLLVIACGLKFVSAALSAHWVLGIDPTRAGVLFNYRLSFGVVAAGAGLSNGLIDQGMYAVMLLVILISAVIPALAMREARPAQEGVGPWP